MATFKHSGDLEDIIFALPAMKLLGGGVLYLDVAGGANDPLVNKLPRGRTRFDLAGYHFIRPLLLEQACVADVRIWQAEAVDFNLDQFRALMGDKVNNPAALHLKAFGLDEELGHAPWLTVNEPPIRLKRANVLHRSARQHSLYFCWLHHLAELTADAIFLGNSPEQQIFQYTFGAAMELHTPGGAVEIARILKGSEKLIGNQSFIMAVAIGLGTPYLLEKYDYGPSWNFRRQNGDWLDIQISPGQTPQPRARVNAPGRAMTFKHSGDLGDIVYSLPAVKALGGGVMYLDISAGENDPFVRGQSNRARTKFTQKAYDTIRPLLMEQDYISDVRIFRGESIDYNLNEVRNYMHPRNNLAMEYLMVFGLDPAFSRPPWLTLKSGPLKLAKPVIVNRTARWHSKDHIWERDLPGFGYNAVFMGYAEEHAIFQYTFDVKMDLHVPADALEMARILKGSQVLVANQSFLMAVAIGLGTPFIQETHDYVPNCVFAGALGRCF